MQRIRVHGDQFRRGEEPFVLWGFNYWPSTSPGSDPVGGDWSVLCHYQPEVVAREVAAMAACGANTLRVWFAYADAHWTAAHTLSATGRRHLAHFLETCAAHGLYVILTVGGAGSLWGGARGFDNPFVETPALVYTDPAVEAQFTADVLTLLDVAGVKSSAHVLAIDLANEPIFGIPSASHNGMDATWSTHGGLDFDASLRIPSAVTAWAHWVEETYGSLTSARDAWGLASDADALPVPVAADFLAPGPRAGLATAYQAFVHSCFRRHGRRLAAAIRAQAPETLVTLGFGCGGTGAEFEGGSARETLQTLMLTQNVREMQDGLDFTCVHLYDNTDARRLAFLREFLGSARPIVIEEFGYIPQHVDPGTLRESPADAAAQAALWETILSGTLRCNYAGALGCNYTDTANPDPARNTWARMGIVTASGQPKESFTSFRKWATSGTLPADVHPESLPCYPDSYRHDVQALGACYAAYRT
ncbi:MAG TPA: hypothetical protein VGM23_02755 [Armatimonadota bacterium]|jgi:hypothetical protein